MTTIPMQSGQAAIQQRPAASAGPAPTGGLGAVDPLKLLQKHKWLLAGAAVVGGVVGVAANIVWMRTYPIWRPIVLFKATPPPRGAAEAAELAQSQEEMNRFMATEAKHMVSDTVLQRVAKSNDLLNKAPKWCAPYMVNGTFNYEEALEELRSDVSARVIASTNLIEMSVSFRDKVEATDILKLTRTKYLEVIEESGRNERDNRTLSLREGIERAESDIQAQYRRRKILVDTNKIESIRSAVEAAQAQVRSTEDELTNVQLSIEALRRQRDTMEAQFNSSSGLTYSEELRGEVDKDPLVLERKQRISSIQSAQQSLLNAGKTTEHRSYQRLESQLRAEQDTLELERSKLLKQRFESQLDGIRSEVSQREAQESKLLAARQELKERSTTLATIDGELTDIETTIKALLESKAQNEQDLSRVKMIDSLNNANRVVVLQDANVPTDMAFPKLAFMLPLGILLTTGLVGGGVLVRELLDQRVKGPSDIAIMPRTRLVGWVPDAAEDPSGQGAVETAFRDRARGVVAESYRQIRASLAKRLESSGHRSLLVLAGMPGSGATTTVANLALAFAAAERRVLVIDANFRRPALNRIFGLPEGPGLGDVLGRTIELGAAVQATSTPGVEVLTAGTKESRVLERLGTGGMSALLTTASATYDLVLVDTAPAIVAGDGMALAQRCDATLLVVRAFGEKRGLVARIRNELSESRGEFLGVLVNSVRASAGGYLRGNFRATQEYHQP
ncbi:MAG: polysaccharide biosynthesis tyrosine autokinase [Phycisphaerales bacterium]